MGIHPEQAESLVRQALAARENAYCPYSNFAVGAALLCGDGTVYTGCNVETAAFNGCCAERTVLFYAAAQGKRDFTALAVAGAGKGRQPDFFCTPCGVCRQVMREFCRPDFEIILTGGKDIKTVTLADLLPMAFGPDSLQ